MGLAFDAVTANVLNVAMADIKDILQLLDDGSNEVKGSRFDAEMPTAPAHFGGSSSGHALGYEHHRAYGVMRATVLGIAADLTQFGELMTTAVTDATDADEESAADTERLNRRLQAAGSMSNTSKNSGTARDEQAETTPDEVPAEPTAPTGNEGKPGPEVCAPPTGAPEGSA